MVKPLTKGFSLVETLISSVLLAMLSLSLIHTNLALGTFNNSSQAYLERNWVKRNLLTGHNLDLIEDLLEVESIHTIFYRYEDTNADGIDDTWMIVTDTSTPNAFEKQVIDITFSNGTTQKHITGVAREH